MKKALGQHHLILKKSSIHRYGVFAKKQFRAKAIIEKCPVLIFPGDAYPKSLSNYIFNFSETEKAIPLGFGCLYNHSDTPNVTHYLSHDKQLMLFKALRPIKPGEEIFIFYGETWFQEREIAVRTEKVPLWRRWSRHQLHSLRMLLRFLIIAGSLYGLIYGPALLESTGF